MQVKEQYIRELTRFSDEQRLLNDEKALIHPRIINIFDLNYEALKETVYCGFNFGTCSCNNFL